MLQTEEDKKKCLLVEKNIFMSIHESLIRAFEEKCQLQAHLMQDYQLYGYNNYDEKVPSLKKYIFEQTGIWANGKYLYNKLKEIQQGKLYVKISREFIYLYFNALNFRDIFDFLQQNTSISEENRVKQFELLGKKQTNIEYYVAYYWGENNNIIKCKFIIYDWTEVDWILYYWENEDTPSQYAFRKGKLSLNRSGYTILFPKEHSEVKTDAFMNIYAGNLNVLVRTFMIGSYMGFDINNCPVVGEIIFQKVVNEIELEKYVLDRTVSLQLVEKLNGKRIIIENILPQELTEIQQKPSEIKPITTNTLFNGNYQLSYENEENQVVYNDLVINNSKFIIIAEEGNYAGSFVYFNSTNLICNIETFNEQPFYAQLQFFIGRRNKDKLQSVKGKYFTMTIEMKPIVFDILLSVMNS